LGLHPKAHNVKIALAQRLRKETTMSWKWIALRLQMGSWSYVSNLLAANRGRRRSKVQIVRTDPFTIQDSTSPAHHGFQVWYDDDPEALDHVRREDFDPGAGSRLDKATAWLWTFFVCNNPPTALPSDFFRGLGMDAKP